jgi:hypothetical protein
MTTLTKLKATSGAVQLTPLPIQDVCARSEFPAAILGGALTTALVFAAGGAAVTIPTGASYTAFSIVTSAVTPPSSVAVSAKELAELAIPPA